jgi:hypothetical protein
VNRIRFLKPYKPPPPSTPWKMGVLFLALLLFILLLAILYTEQRDRTNRALDDQRREHERRMEKIKSIRKGY